MQINEADLCSRSRLWTVEDIAYYLSLSKNRVLQGIVTRTDFPAPIRFAKERGRRWEHKDIERWAQDQKQFKTGV